MSKKVSDEKSSEACCKFCPCSFNETRLAEFLRHLAEFFDKD